MKNVWAVLAAGAWISLSEFVRNELLFKSFWIEKYQSLGLTFPSAPLNNALWGVWSFVLAGVMLFLVKKLSLIAAGITVWIMSFVLMWIVVGNLDILPLALLPYAVPLSLLEVLVAALLCRAIAGDVAQPKHI